MNLTAIDVVNGKRPRLRDVVSGNALDAPQTVRPDDSVLTVARQIDQAGVGAALVVDIDDLLVGLVSPRDIVRHISRAGAQALEWPVERIMTRDVWVERDDTLCQTTLTQMIDFRFRNMPVYTSEQQLLACVETLDITNAKLAELTQSNRKLLELLISQNDERNTVRPSDNIALVAQRMRGSRLDYVIVHDGEKCLGFITPDEVLRAVHQQSHSTKATEKATG